MELSSITGSKEAVDDHGPVDSASAPPGYVVTVDNTSYVTVEGARYAGEFSDYLRSDRERPQDQLYSLSQRFEYDRKEGDPGGQNMCDDDGYDPRNYTPLQVCVYPMSRVVLHLDLEDGVNCTVQDLIHAVFHIDEFGLPRTPLNVFTIWMCSGLVELQLKPHHKPFEMRQQWGDLLKKYSSASESRRQRDEPMVSFQRNVFYPRREEEKIKDQKVLDLLYEEAKFNILEGRYPCENQHYYSLGGIQARIELGTYNPQVHDIQFFRENYYRFLPAHIRPAWSWLRISGKNSPEVKLLEQYKRIPTSMPNRRLVRKYLEFCWNLPYYGAAFFQGQIEQPVRGLTSLVTHQDIPVHVAINTQGVYIVDQIQATLFLGLKYQDMSWDFARPSQEYNSDCLPCLFLQFMVLENGARVSKILQVFSKQAVMMDALISVFVEESKKRSTIDEVDTSRQNADTSNDNEDSQLPLNNRRELVQSCLSNKLSKLTLATFDDEGRCIGKMGSWSFSY